jgi:hypothetical protein
MGTDKAAAGREALEQALKINPTFAGSDDARQRLAQVSADHNPIH